MNKVKYMGTMAFIILSLLHFTSIPVSAAVTEYQNPDTSMEESSMDCEVIYKTTYDFTETIPKYPKLEVSNFGYEGVYDGELHGITVDCKIDGAVILYSSDGKTFTTKKPVYKNVGTYLTYFKVEKEGYMPAVGSATVRIMEAEIKFDIKDYNGIYDGRFHGIELSARTRGCKISYSEDGINFSFRKPEYKEPGTYVVYYRISKENYATVTGSGKVTIAIKNNTANSNNNNSAGVKQDIVSSVQTGDDSQILLYVVMSAFSGVCLMKIRRKERKKL